jgi:hypothetical protein
MDSKKWRELMKEKSRVFQAERRAAIGADPRVRAIKSALKDKAKARRREIILERKQQRQARVAEERAQRDAALPKLVRPATPHDDVPS